MAACYDQKREIDLGFWVTLISICLDLEPSQSVYSLDRRHASMFSASQLHRAINPTEKGEMQIYIHALIDSSQIELGKLASCILIVVGRS